MKKELHPQYFNSCKVKCACGAKFVVGSTKEEMEVEICYQCHPFFTGKEKLVDSQGRIEKFKARIDKKIPTINKKVRKSSQERKSKKIV